MSDFAEIAKEAKLTQAVLLLPKTEDAKTISFLETAFFKKRLLLKRFSTKSQFAPYFNKI